MTLAINGRIISLTVPVAMQTLGSLAMGGALGAVSDFFQQGFDMAKMDWHRVGVIAAGGALAAVIQHYRTSPLVKL